MSDIQHHGVLGQKWGVHRRISQIRDRHEAKVRSGQSDDANQARAATQKISKSKRGIKSLSNEELQALVTRMNLEQQLVGLKDRQPSKIKEGHKLVKEVLDAGATVNKALAFQKSAAGQAVTKALLKKIKAAKAA